MAALVVAALVLVYVFTDDKHSAPAGALSNTEQDALAHADLIVAATSAYNYKTFDKDFAAALAVTSGGMKSDLQKAEAATKKQFVASKLIVTSKIRHTALVGPATPSTSKSAPVAYVVLVNFYTYTSANPASPNPQNLQITVQKIKGKWYGVDATSVGIQ